MPTLPVSVTVSVPASTSNCGSGFDTLGLALALHNEITLVRAADPTCDLWHGQTSADARGDDMVNAGARLFFARCGQKPFGGDFRVVGAVPTARGLGSSITVLAGVIFALNAMTGVGWTPRQIAALLTEIEGHPDNATAGVLGGFCVGRCDPVSSELLAVQRVTVDANVRFVVSSPAVELQTKASRAVLPKSLPYRDAIRSINHAAFLTAAIIRGDFPALNAVQGDFMHEPYRLPGIPGGAQAIAAGVNAGAYTGWLSGSGSSVLTVCSTSIAERVAKAMAEALVMADVPGETRILLADNRGAWVKEATA